MDKKKPTGGGEESAPGTRQELAVRVLAGEGRGSGAGLLGVVDATNPGIIRVQKGALLKWVKRQPPLQGERK